MLGILALDLYGGLALASSVSCGCWHRVVDAYSLDTVLVAASPVKEFTTHRPSTFTQHCSVGL